VVGVKGKGRYSSRWGEPHLRAMTCQLPYGITQCYLPPDTSECAPPNPSHAGWYSIYLPRRDGRLSWPLLLFLCVINKQSMWCLPSVSIPSSRSPDISRLSDCWMERCATFWYSVKTALSWAWLLEQRIWLNLDSSVPQRASPAWYNSYIPYRHNALDLHDLSFLTSYKPKRKAQSQMVKVKHLL